MSSDNPVTSVHGGLDTSCSLQLCGCSIIACCVSLVELAAIRV